MIFGSKEVIVVVGAHKIVENVEKALERIKKIAAPANAKRVKEKYGLNVPCAKIGTCINCDSKHRICNIVCIIERKPRAVDMKVVLVGEKLGL